MNSRGILNIEIMVLLIIVCIVFSLLFSIVFGELTAIDETQNRKESRIIAADVSNCIIKVYQMGDGASIMYKLPPKINKETYILKINDTGVYVNSHYQLTYSKLIPNILRQKQYFLESDNVYVFINNNNTVDVIQNY